VGIRLLTTSGERGARVTLDQKRARVFGVLYLITFLTSIPALLLFQPVLDDRWPISRVAGRTTGSSSERFWSCC
jgi:hypothetical protein